MTTATITRKKNVFPRNSAWRRLCLVLTLAAGSTSAASDVVELQPGELSEFVSRHGRVVVQFTSPDRGCSYCIGADTSFDAVAALNQDDTLVFARVQWSPWRPFPSSELGYELYGIPQQIVFRDGHPFGQVSGTPKDPEALLRELAKIAETGSKVSFVPPRAAAPNPVVATPRGLDETERNAVSLLMRTMFIESLISTCATKYPEHTSGYTSAFSTWNQPHRDELDKAATVMLKHLQDDILSPDGPLSRSEERKMQAWLKGIGVDMASPPAAADCSRIAQNLHTLR
ncbi:thioredoxin family protein [Pseudothauera lacus]|uniref:Thioredoxin domain-containing protein n=1 Tax=Pseudothauera lacus TaxID=2136175 RepID=A0A2T4IBU7_9RHOO|nr:thioredoxin family protein [Pseudothauera lacus]PTD95208.1 hypothetical protein C8261_15555 [Pseudothauera lacus]